MTAQLKKAIAAGFVTTILTAYAHGLLVTLIGFSPYGLTIALIFPIGALVCGYLAMYGFVHVAKQGVGHAEGLQRPLPVLLFAMLVAGFLGQFLIFWLEYMGAFLPGHSLQPILTFGNYLQFALSNGQIVMSGHSFEPDSGPPMAAMVIAQIVAFLMVPVVTYKQLPGSRSYLED